MRIVVASCASACGWPAGAGDGTDAARRAMSAKPSQRGLSRRNCRDVPVEPSRSHGARADHRSRATVASVARPGALQSGEFWRLVTPPRDAAIVLGVTSLVLV